QPETIPEPEIEIEQPETIPEPEIEIEQPETIPEPEIEIEQPETIPEPEIQIEQPETMPEPELQIEQPEIIPELEIQIEQPEIIPEPEIQIEQLEIIPEPELEIEIEQPETIPEPEIEIEQPETIPELEIEIEQPEPIPELEIEIEQPGTIPEPELQIEQPEPLYEPEIEIEQPLEDERKRLLYEYNNTESDFPKDKTLYRLFDEQAEKTPTNRALTCTESGTGQNGHDIEGVVEQEEALFERRITYRELNAKALRLARTLLKKGVGPDTIVAVATWPSNEMLTAIFGILKAGGAYLPVTTALPDDKIRYILKDSGTKLLLSAVNENHTGERLSELSKSSGCEFIDINQLNEEPEAPSAPATFLSFLRRTPTAPPAFPATHITAANLAYVIYTTGPTGKPTGVMVEHHSVVNLLHALHTSYPSDENDVYLLKTPYMFNVSVSEIFGWIMGGGSLALLKKGDEDDHLKVVEAVYRNGITRLNFIPSVFETLVDTLLLNEKEKSKLAGLKYIFLTGERLRPALMAKYRQLELGIPVENLYGTTENTVYTTRYSVAQWDGSDTIPIGKPLPNIKLFIMDPEGNPSPHGTPGELFIAGEGLARGYLNHPQLTRQQYITTSDALLKDTPIENENPTQDIRLYKTGDIARWLPEGDNIEILGRSDNQVKFRALTNWMSETEDTETDPVSESEKNVESSPLNGENDKKTVKPINEEQEDNRQPKPEEQEEQKEETKELIPAGQKKETLDTETGVPEEQEQDSADSESEEDDLNSISSVFEIEEQENINALVDIASIVELQEEETIPLIVEEQEQKNINTTAEEQEHESISVIDEEQEIESISAIAIDEEQEQESIITIDEEQEIESISAIAIDEEQEVERISASAIDEEPEAEAIPAPVAIL
ncbi:MAG: AMP-binding protein, partial [bacterium]|nr:AMP-binding protein [bacterium]